ncbi:hypothetical protein [Marinoscillum pacificum]|uniref:hypothetical protein n=1 Tax=Marinoscillum pacificum TaxID=392723 RepID=UPI002157D433|nr:hypothetical protein [Marinoscillum pacificum]
MKYLIMCALSVVLFASDAHNDQKGPAYKNRKPCKGNRQASQVMALVRNELKGPEIKNRKPWSEETSQVPMISSTRDDLKGPAAKNYMPYKRTSSKSGFMANGKK